MMKTAFFMVLVALSVTGKEARFARNLLVDALDSILFRPCLLQCLIDPYVCCTSKPMPEITHAEYALTEQPGDQLSILCHVSIRK